jgi:hypothetical protein
MPEGLNLLLIQWELRPLVDFGERGEASFCPSLSKPLPKYSRSLQAQSRSPLERMLWRIRNDQLQSLFVRRRRDQSCDAGLFSRRNHYGPLGPVFHNIAHHSIAYHFGSFQRGKISRIIPENHAF